MRYLTFTASLTLSILLFSCSEKVAEQVDLKPKEIGKEGRIDDIFINPLEMPTFQGKDIAEFSKWVSGKVEFPEVAYANGIQGRAFIGFCVEADGSVSNVTVLRSLHKLIDEEVVRVVLSSPKWEPGLDRRVPTRVRCSITVAFPAK